MRASFPPARRGRHALRALARNTGRAIFTIVAIPTAYWVGAALVGATLAALGMDPYAADGWARIGGVFALGLLLVALYVRRLP